jgi:ribosomal protein L10
MAITKDKKKALLATYVSDLKDATNAVIIKQTGIPVALANKIRIELKAADGKMSILKKRIFLRALKDA